MTVRELIEHLKTLPQDYLVCYRNCSDSQKMEPDEICVVHASDKQVVQHHNIPDAVRDYRGRDFRGSGIEPKFLDVVLFPGN